MITCREHLEQALAVATCRVAVHLPQTRDRAWQALARLRDCHGSLAAARRALPDAADLFAIRGPACA